MDPYAPAQTKEVVPIDKQANFNAYPEGSLLASLREYFDAGLSLNVSENNDWNVFFAAVERAKNEDASGENQLARDLLPPIVRDLSMSYSPPLVRGERTFCSVGGDEGG